MAPGGGAGAPTHNPIFEDPTFRRDLPELRRFEDIVASTFYEPGEARRIAQIAGLGVAEIATSGPPSAIWAGILELAAARGRLWPLLDALDAEPANDTLKLAISAVRSITRTGSLQPHRLLLEGNRPFLGRKNLRGVLPELQNWRSAASVLVVRGAPDSGRTETQALLADRNRDRQVLLDENMPLSSSVRRIWRAADLATDPPALGVGGLTTEAAQLTDFWIDVYGALERHDLRLWVLFDDLDKGPGRLEVRMLAEELAIRLREVAFQRRLRLVLLGYPEPELPRKVPAAVVRNDTTEDLDASHVQAFLDYCLTAAGKNFDPAQLAGRAGALCQEAQAQAAAALAAGRDVSYHEALNGVLTAWYQTEIR